MEYKRPQFQTFMSRINERRNKIQVLIGPRQVGKTTLMEQVLTECQMPYESVSADDVVGVSADWLAEVWEMQRMKMAATGEGKRLLVVDEIQKIVNWSEVVKAEWDRDTREHRELVVVLLGSSRMLIEKGLTESLAGRFELIRLPHWSYTEMRDCFGWPLSMYMYYGSYPGSVEFVSDYSRWRHYIKDSLIETTIAKDALLDTKIMKPQLLRQLFELGCSYSSQLLSLTKIAAQLQDVGNVTTLAGYLHLLDECGLLCGLQKFAADKARKYNSIPKFQVYNNALRSVICDESYEEVMQNPRLWGRVTESAVGAYLVSQAGVMDYNVYFWRDGAEEVDFVLQKGNKIVAIEVKSGRRSSNKGLSIFRETFHPTASLIVGTGGLSLEEFFLMDISKLFNLIY